MYALAIVLAIWMTYIEIEHPNRTKECPYNEWECSEEENEDARESD